ncbi:MAG: GTPase HflX [Calditerrivibrio sp.]|nr:GTPase HflX [Calditerrivibrio sp.]
MQFISHQFTLVKEEHILYGYTEHLKVSYLRTLEKLIKKKNISSAIISGELIKKISSISKETGRQIGILIDRNNIIQYVLVGTNKEVLIPKLDRFAITPGKLRGLRLIHTHLYGEDIDQDDITDLKLLRLDAVAVLKLNDNGEPYKLQMAYLHPSKEIDLLEYKDPYDIKDDFISFVNAIEDEFLANVKERFLVKKSFSAVLVGSYTNKKEAEESIAELKELCRTAEISPEKVFYQIKTKIDPKYVVGPGKLKEIILFAMQNNIDYLIFDNVLTPAQSRSISEQTEMKILDRTQLILDIFARRAKSNEGKIRVELAQLKHILPRLTGRDDSLSRLTGGIGGRGPGETKLEIDKRRIRDRIAFLTKKLKELESVRNTQRTKRTKRNLPVVSIVGYTNAGKSTLLNKLTNSEVYADNLMFATLDTTSKRLRFPKERECILTDTVGFIRNLPESLKGAFKSTLEELVDSDLLIHLVDISNSQFKKHIVSVSQILDELKLSEKQRILVFNKIDLITSEKLSEYKKEYPDALFISALDRTSFREMLTRINHILFLGGKKIDLPIRDYFEKI